VDWEWEHAPIGIFESRRLCLSPLKDDYRTAVGLLFSFGVERARPGSSQQINGKKEAASET